MKLFSNSQLERSATTKGRSSDRGFTLMEVSVSLVIMMVAGLGAASLFAYATNYNSGADDREMAMAIAQKRMEWLRTIPFHLNTSNLAYSYPNGGLAATSSDGVVETATNAGRSYLVRTTIQDLSFVPAGQPNAGQPTVKRIEVTVTPQGTGTSFGSVRISTQRSTLVTGIY